MSEWIVIPSLLALQEEYNKVSPKRDKGADGTIGDSSHTSSSDHTPDEDSIKLRDKDADHVNEVHALDIDSTGPWPDGKRGDIAGSWFDNKIKMIIATEKKRWEDPNDMCRLNYIIWRGMIYDKDNDWKGKVYTATPDKHFNHAHFSARYETRAENDTRSWGVYVPPKPVTPPEEELPVDQAAFDKLFNGYITNPSNAQKFFDALLNSKVGSKVWPTRTWRNFFGDLWGVRDFQVGDTKGSLPANSGIGPDSPIAKAYKGVTDSGDTLHATESDQVQ